MLKKIIQNILERYATALLKKHHPKIVTITGSVGKTSTKAAVTTVLKEHFKVLATEGNFNVDVVVPLQLFGISPPRSMKNPLAWVAIFAKMTQVLRNKYDYEVVVLELGVDKPGDMDTFMKYLHPDMAVITAITPEHMEQFGTMEMVAQEELKITNQCKLAIFNRDEIDYEFDHLNNAPTSYSYGFSKDADYQFRIDKFTIEFGFDGIFLGEGLGELRAQLRVVGEHNIKPVIAAVAVGTELGVPHDKIAEGVANIEPVNGRMNLLHGAEKTIVIDDSYNSSPVAAVAALKTLYSFKAKKRVAVLGSMNELGDHTEAAHKEVGEACDPKKLDLIITVGEVADKYLAPVAKKQGCTVESFLSPYDAGAYLRGKLKPGMVILVKGSQNRVFTEEVVKLILADNEDESFLVRQDPHWMQVKQTQFNQL